MPCDCKAVKGYQAILQSFGFAVEQHRPDVADDAGRIREGVYMCLIPRDFYRSLEPFPLPELQRLPLEEVSVAATAAPCLLGQSRTPASYFRLAGALLSSARC